MKISTLIFDFGGVLMRTEDLAPRRKWEARYGMKDWGLANLVFANPISDRAMVGAASTDEVWQHVAEELELDTDELTILQRDFWSGDKLDISLTDYVAARRGRMNTAILSNAWSDARAAFSRFPQLTEAFELWVISAEEGVAKPEAEIYMRTLERIGVEPVEAVFVDDFTRNVRAAEALGMHAIHYESGMDVPAELARLGVD